MNRHEMGYCPCCGALIDLHEIDRLHDHCATGWGTPYSAYRHIKDQRFRNRRPGDE